MGVQVNRFEPALGAQRFGAVVCSFSAHTSSGSSKSAGFFKKLTWAVQGRGEYLGIIDRITVMVFPPLPSMKRSVRCRASE